MSIFVLSFVLCPNRQASLYAFKQPYRPANEAIHSFLLSCACLTSNSKSEPFSTDRRHATDDLAGFLLKRIAMSVWHIATVWQDFARPALTLGLYYLPLKLGSE